MYCTRCGTNNAKTAKFCRECGRKIDLGIPVESPDEEQVRVEPGADTTKRVGELLFQAFQDFEHDDYDASTKLCYEAVRLDSQNTSAHSLLGMIYEKKGDDEAAIRHYQRVLAVNPKSIADREKLEELLKRRTADSVAFSLNETVRQYIQVSLEYLASKRPWPGVIGAFLITFMFLYAIWPNQPATQTGTQGQTEASGQTPGQAPSLGQQNPAPTPPNAGGDLSFIGGGSSPSRSSTPQQEYTPPQRAPVQALPPAATATRPYRTTPLPGLTRVTDLPPVRIEPRPAPQQRNTAQPAPAASREPAPVISITRSTPPTPAAPKNPVAQARSLQMSGQYDEAISAWRQALTGAKYPGSIHQQMATCYQRLGKNGEAASSYQDAVRSYQQQISAGYRVDEAQRGMKSSELGAKISQREGG